jgi:pimeloyl-ACP methyl ester carboxylesterase
VTASLSTDLRDVLLDGTPYRIAVPPGWNGTLLLDLDFVGSFGSTSPVHEWLLGRGYAVAGTARVLNTVSASVWAHRLLQVLHIVRKDFGRPARVIAYGQSGGGAAARAFAQEMPHGIDGAIAMSTPGSGQVSLLNQALDATFAAKALLAPGNDALVLVGLPVDRTRLAAEWTRVLSAAQETADGRARVALAAALAQLPYWGLDDSALGPPDPRDIPAVQDGFYQALAYVAAGGQRAALRQAVESLAGNPSWNTGIDYARLFQAADAAVRDAVQVLYAQAGLDLGNDLARVNAAPRVAADPAGVDYARESTFDGRLAKPLLYMTTTGDPLCPVSNSRPLETAALAAGAGDLLRMLYVQAPGHCTFTVAEIGAALATVTERIDTGRWPATSPQAMNRRGDSIDPSGTRFLDYDPGPGYRPFFAYSEYPAGQAELHSGHPLSPDHQGGRETELGLADPRAD